MTYLSNLESIPLYDLDDYEQERNRIIADERYTPGLRRWALSQLDRRFKELTGVTPDEARRQNG